MEKPHILIVEDDPIIAADLQDRLEEMGFRIRRPVTIGEEAPAFFDESSPPDLVIMDVHLEGEWDGIETARRILEKHELMRVHRSYIVNLAQVEEIGELNLHVGKGRIPFNKNFRNDLMMRLKSA